MSVNIVPNFIAVPKIGTPKIIASNTATIASDGTSNGAANTATNSLFQILAAGANGTFVERVIFMSIS